MEWERGGSMNEGEAERGTTLNEAKRNLNGKYEPIILTTKILTSLPMVSVDLGHHARHTL